MSSLTEKQEEALHRILVSVISQHPGNESMAVSAAKAFRAALAVADECGECGTTTASDVIADAMLQAAGFACGTTKAAEPNQENFKGAIEIDGDKVTHVLRCPRCFGRGKIEFVG